MLRTREKISHLLNIYVVINTTSLEYIILHLQGWKQVTYISKLVAFGHYYPLIIHFFHFIGPKSN